MQVFLEWFSLLFLPWHLKGHKWRIHGVHQTGVLLVWRIKFHHSILLPSQNQPMLSAYQQSIHYNFILLILMFQYTLIIGQRNLLYLSWWACQFSPTLALVKEEHVSNQLLYQLHGCYLHLHQLYTELFRSFYYISFMVYQSIFFFSVVYRMIIPKQLVQC